MAEINGVILQGFHWYTHAQGTYWKELARRAKALAAAGFTAIWLPPACKSQEGRQGVGYSVYDLYDLGEFSQKGARRTKYGTRLQYEHAIRALQCAGLQVYADCVLHQRAGADKTELAYARPFRQGGPLQPSGPRREIKACTHFTFPGRKDQYSPFHWHWHHFTAVDCDAWRPDKGFAYLLEDKTFEGTEALEDGCTPPIAGCEPDYQIEAVRSETLRWGRWYLENTGVDGFRLDALKPGSARFFSAWHAAMEQHAGRELFFMGQRWSRDARVLHAGLDIMGPRFCILDVPLHAHFHAAGRLGTRYDLRTLLEGTLMRERPQQAVTFVDTHDTQPLRPLESFVAPWFKPLAYAVVLLRREGYPCVFLADYDGAAYTGPHAEGGSRAIDVPSHQYLLDIFLHARRTLAHGPQYDYFDDAACIGWTRLGDAAHPGALAVIMSSGPAGRKWMDTGRPHTRFTDLTGHISQPVATNAQGWAEFSCNGGSVSIWAPG